jgi:hypothetical protein
MPSRRHRSSPSDDPAATGLSPANSTTSNESFYSLSPDSQLNGTAASAVGKPWNRVDGPLQKEFSREKKAGKLSFERKVELYGEKLEEAFKDLEEKLLCREEELLLKGRELQRTSPPSLSPNTDTAERLMLSVCFGDYNLDCADHIFRLESGELFIESSC